MKSTEGKCKMKNLTIICMILFLGHRVFGGDAMSKDNTPATIEAALSAPVLSLFHWPDAAVLNGEKAIAPGASIIAAPGKQSWEWINRVIGASWLPSTNAHMHFIGKEFDGRDVTRIEWIHGDYRVEVSQTASIFTMKLIPQRGANMGRDSGQRFEAARQVCRQIFNREGRMWSQDAQGAGRPVVVPDLNEKIGEFSFDAARMKQLPTDKIVVGKARSMKDEGIDSTTPREGPLSVVAPNERSPDAWHYWFRNVNWWNDGQAVGFYFLKVDGPGAWAPSFVGEIDKNWFHGPRDRLGRPISATQN